MIVFFLWPTAVITLIEFWTFGAVNMFRVSTLKVVSGN